MLALNIIDIKDFMNKLLVGDTFDNFLLVEAIISTNVTYTVDGKLNKDFFSDEELSEIVPADERFTPFSILKPVCFDLIKGKRTPLSFKFTFQMSHENMVNTINSIDSGFSANDVTAIFLHLKFEDQKLICTNGISYSTFVLDHTLDHEWDRLLQKFLKYHQIAFEDM